MSPSLRENSEAAAHAFEQIVSRYEKDLLRYAARLMNSPSAAEDVVQEAFLRLYRHWNEPWEPSPLLTAWLYRVTHNCAVDHLRRQARREWLHLQAARHAAMSSEPGPRSNGDITEAAERAAAALEKLSLRERQLVILKVYEEKSYKEIADITGLSISHVGVILHYAMKKLAAELKKSGGL